MGLILHLAATQGARSACGRYFYYTGSLRTPEYISVGKRKYLNGVGKYPQEVVFSQSVAGV